MAGYTLYGMGSPNVVKVAIALEELGQSYDLVHVNVFQGEQREPWFLALNPNGKVPALVESREGGDSILFESGAIMDRLAMRHGAFGGADADGQALVGQWLMFQMANCGPVFGNAIHFTFATQDNPYGANRFQIELRKLLKVIEQRLAASDYLARDYSIADMALWPWIRTLEMFFADDLKTPALRRWFAEIEARPAVTSAIARMDAIGKLDRQARREASAEQLDRYFGRVAWPD
ncbi:MAG: glutathione S-transferase family protein [Alphaproteobacteria bacterium]|nr:glutathione S-transferase family protein [Alphaproteobacteria bacterium]